MTMKQKKRAPVVAWRLSKIENETAGWRFVVEAKVPNAPGMWVRIALFSYKPFAQAAVREHNAKAKVGGP